MHPSRLLLILAIAFIWYETIAMNNAATPNAERMHKNDGRESAKMQIMKSDREVFLQKQHDEMVRKEKLDHTNDDPLAELKAVKR